LFPPWKFLLTVSDAVVRLSAKMGGFIVKSGNDFLTETKTSRRFLTDGWSFIKPALRVSRSIDADF
jgi:hypothetical protein